MRVLTESEKDLYKSPITWETVMSGQRDNVNNCLCNRKTQLSTRNKKLVLSDLRLCQDFEVDFRSVTELLTTK